jgi:hypothetical protein
MLSFCALIGIGVILWWISRGLKKFGIFLTTLSGEMADYLGAVQQQKIKPDMKLRQQNKNAAERIQTIKGADSDAYYQRKVQQEIDQLCE